MCNLLVIVAFVYRICRRGSDLDAMEDPMSFTSVDLDTGFSESAADKYTMTITQHSMVSETSRSTMTGTIEVEEKEVGPMGSSLA